MTTPTSRIRAGNGPSRVALIWKMRPSSASSRRRARGSPVEALDVADGQHPPAVAAASIMAWASSRVAAIGFSTSTFAPQRSARAWREVEAGRRDDADEVEPRPASARRPRSRARRPAVARARRGIGIRDRDQSTSSTTSSQTRTWLRPSSRDPPRRRSGRPARSSSGRCSLKRAELGAVSLTAPMTVATSSSVSDGWTGMLSTWSVSRSVTG